MAQQQFSEELPSEAINTRKPIQKKPDTACADPTHPWAGCRAERGHSSLAGGEMSAEGRSQEEISVGQVRHWCAHFSSHRCCWSLPLPVSSFILTQLGFTKPRRNSSLADQISNEQSSCWGKCNYTLFPTGRYHLQGAQPALWMLLCGAAPESGLPWRIGGTRDWAIATCNYCIYHHL